MIKFIKVLFNKKQVNLENSNYKKIIFGGNNISKIKTSIDYTNKHDYNNMRLAKMSSRFE